ncbi:hypothetical protein HMI54_014879 [Coelomomyces lativittatus]|nr:hypothetical protein HMI54_014879 [Coelomomyces lativittatus]
MFHSLLRSTKLASSILYSPISTFPAKTSTTTKALGSLFSSSSFVTWSPVHVFSLMKKKGNLPAYRLITTSTSRLMNKETNEPSVEREIEKVDVLIVGAGPAGLSAAIRLKQLALEHQKEIRVMVIEKGAEIGSHILSGNVLEPRALNELIPDWKEKGAPLHTPATEDHIYFLTKKHAIPLPHPPHLKNKGNYVISLSLFVKWLGEQAENLGVEIYPGISGASLLLKKHAHDTPPLNTENQSGKSTPPSPSTSTALYGVRTGDLGLNADMTVSKNYSPGMEIHAPLTLLAEGCHGSLTKKTIQTFQLRAKDTILQA